MEGCIYCQGLSPTAQDHAHEPQNFGPLSDFNGHARITGPCGDTMEFWLLVRDNRVEKASFITDGCASSLACGSMATCLAEGKNVEEAAVLRQQDILEALGGLPKKDEHCALLAAITLEGACEDYLNHGKIGVQEKPEGIIKPILALDQESASQERIGH